MAALRIDRWWPALVLAALLGCLAVHGAPVRADASPIVGVPATDGHGAAREEVVFSSGPFTLYGTLLLPAGAAGPVPAALIIAGSGPTDRNGNSALLDGEIGNLRFFADTLAAAGIASLRYDKPASGRTGLQGLPADQLDFHTFIDAARAAYAYLAARPEIDAARIGVLGHSEGGLLALEIAQPGATVTPPRALVLASPLSVRYLDLLRAQIAPQFEAAARQELLPEDEARDALAELDEIIADLRATGRVGHEIRHPALAVLFNEANWRFLADADRSDPEALAASLPLSVPVIVMRGAKDTQVFPAHVAMLVAALRDSGHTVEAVELPNVNHVFRVVEGTPDPSTDYTNPDLPFSPEAAGLLMVFARAWLIDAP